MQLMDQLDNHFITRLRAMRAYGGRARTTGLSDEIILRFARSDSLLEQAVEEAWLLHQELQKSFPEVLALDEADQARAIQEQYVNFYSEDTVNPYIALSARGPWIVTAKGAVIHDSGGYGMLGLGHNPPGVMAALTRPQVMANVMTPNFSQLRLARALDAEIGHSRDDGCPYARYVCINSGSEAVTVAARIADINAKAMTDPGGRHSGKPIKAMSMKGAFHGRTDRPARFSHSTLSKYREHLASFREAGHLLTVPPNDVGAVEAVFAAAEAQGFFIEAFFIEPVMGEGNPGLAITREFYDAVRRLTREHGGLLLVDSIQAGLRAHGCLSIVDYPGFQDCDPPDMETYSKALNAGQYPLSVLALDKAAAGLYRKGVYGNTMTTNPRAMDVACAVLQCITPAVRSNIRIRGEQFIEQLGALASELDGAITAVQGTGLLFSCELDTDRYLCFGAGSVEEYLRMKGIGVIHGGANSLRFTPHFNIGADEVALVVDAIRDALVNGPRKN